MAVIGLDKFREHFAEHADKYTIIGGTATMLALEEAGLEGRSTKDIDIVLSLEVLDEAFAASFWEFVKAGGYEQREKDEKLEFYRFLKPTNDVYPRMIEIFSRRPDTLKPSDGQVVARIPLGAALGSLSAILLDDEYYSLLHARRKLLQEVMVVDEYGLICLKAYAWVQLTAARAGGQEINGDDIRKHSNDVMRLYGLVQPDARVPLSPKVAGNLRLFLAGLDRTKDLKPLGLAGTSVTQVVEGLTAIFDL